MALTRGSAHTLMAVVASNAFISAVVDCHLITVNTFASLISNPFFAMSCTLYSNSDVQSTMIITRHQSSLALCIKWTFLVSDSVL